MSMFFFTPQCCCAESMSPCYLGADYFRRSPTGVDALPNALVSGYGINLPSGNPPITYSFIGEPNNWSMASGILTVSGANSFLVPHIEHPDGLYNIMMGLSGYNQQSGDSLIFGFNYNGDINNCDYIEYYFPVISGVDCRFYNVREGIKTLVKQESYKLSTGIYSTWQVDNGRQHLYGDYRWYLGGVTDMYQSTSALMPSEVAANNIWLNRYSGVPHWSAIDALYPNHLMCGGENSSVCWQQGIPRMFGGIAGHDSISMGHMNYMESPGAVIPFATNTLPYIFNMTNIPKTIGVYFTGTNMYTTEYGWLTTPRAIAVAMKAGIPDGISIPIGLEPSGYSTNIGSGYFFGIGNTNNVIRFSGALGIARTMSILDVSRESGIAMTGQLYNSIGGSGIYDNKNDIDTTVRNWPCVYLKDTVVARENDGLSTPDQYPKWESSYPLEVLAGGSMFSGRYNFYACSFTNSKNGGDITLQHRNFDNPTLHGSQAASTMFFGPVGTALKSGMSLAIHYGVNSGNKEYFIGKCTWLTDNRVELRIDSSLYGNLKTEIKTNDLFLNINYLELCLIENNISLRTYRTSASSFGGLMDARINLLSTLAATAINSTNSMAELSIPYVIPTDKCIRRSQTIFVNNSTGNWPIIIALYPTLRSTEFSTNAEYGSPYLGRTNTSYVPYVLGTGGIVPYVLESLVEPLPSNTNINQDNLFKPSGYYHIGHGRGGTTQLLELRGLGTTKATSVPYIGRSVQHGYGFTSTSSYGSARIYQYPISGNIYAYQPYVSMQKGLLTNLLGNDVLPGFPTTSAIDSVRHGPVARPEHPTLIDFPDSVFVSFEGASLTLKGCIPNGIRICDIVDFLQGEYEIPRLTGGYIRPAGGTFDSSPSGTLIYYSQFYYREDGLFCKDKTPHYPSYWVHEYEYNPTASSGGIEIIVELPNSPSNYTSSTKPYIFGGPSLFSPPSVQVRFFEFHSGCNLQTGNAQRPFDIGCTIWKLDWISSYPTSYSPVAQNDYRNETGRGFNINGVMWNNPHTIQIDANSVLYTGTSYLDSYAGFDSLPLQYGISNLTTTGMYPLRLFSKEYTDSTVLNITNYSTICSVSNPFPAFPDSSVSPTIGLGQNANAVTTYGSYNLAKYLENGSCVQVPVQQDGAFGLTTPPKYFRRSTSFPVSGTFPTIVLSI